MEQKRKARQMSWTKIKWKWDWGVVHTPYGDLISYHPTSFMNNRASGKHQPHITDLIRTGNYDVFIDVGAAFGVFTLVASEHCPKVISYEASPFRFGFLLENTCQKWNVECRYAYVSKKGDTGKKSEDFYMPIRKEKKQPVPYNIPVVTLDDELANLLEYDDVRVLIKVDVEGNELNLLEGAQTIIPWDNFHWNIEVHRAFGVQAKDVLKHFKNRDHQKIGTTYTIR